VALFGGDKSDWRDAQATVLSEDPKGGSIGDTKHGRFYWKKNELQLSLAFATGESSTVHWKGNVPESICYSMTGRTFPVKVHPTKPEKLDIDWDEIVGWHKLRDASGEILAEPGTAEAPAPEPIVSFSGSTQVRVNQGPPLTGEAAQAELDRLGIHVETTSEGVKITRPGAVGSSDNVDKLEKLAHLKEQGLLTADEFETAKKQLLGES
jgi:hypothetical protein